MAYIMGSLKGNALAWASALWDSDSPVNDNFDLFVAEMRKVFNHPVGGGDAAKHLISLHTRSVAEFSVEFRTYAARSGWNDKALRGLFLSSLSESIKDELATREEAETLDEMIDSEFRTPSTLYFLFPTLPESYPLCPRETCRARRGTHAAGAHSPHRS